MRHLVALEELSLPASACMAIGAFDGVHRGHQALIGAMVRAARIARDVAVVLTFFPHPSVVLGGRRPAFYLTAPPQKEAHLAALGLDVLVTLPFDDRLAAISAVEFVERLMHFARLSALWCGEDFALGQGREGNVSFLRAAGERYSFAVHVVPRVRCADGEVISSTRIRQAVRDGAVEQAARYLGRPFCLPGTVMRGARRGRVLGFPTANLQFWEEHACPAAGVYAARARHAGGMYQAVVNVGVRPTFEAFGAPLAVEAHLLDFSGDLYGAALTLEFVARLRGEAKFPDAADLRAQIARDVTMARRVLNGEASRAGVGCG